MILNKFLWNIYKDSQQGKEAINLFTNGEPIEILNKYYQNSQFENTDFVEAIEDLLSYLDKPLLPDVLEVEQAKYLFDEIINNGVVLKYDDNEYIELNDKNTGFLGFIPVISTWLFFEYPDFFKPYFWVNNFKILTQISDTFKFELPPVPLKKHRDQRIKYYWQLCEVFMEFQAANEMSASEFCAFLYDFAPNYINQNSNEIHYRLPQPTQVWMVGGNKGGGDLQFLDGYKEGEESFWQGNVDTKRGDIIVMYCLAPYSYIHSIWRATQDGIADPFFHYYSNIYIGNRIKIEPISLNELKTDEHFSKHPLIKKNLQGVSGYLLNSMDYERILHLLRKKGENTEHLPTIYTPSFSSNQSLKIEKDVESVLLEPFLISLGYTEKDWIRQLPVRMGRGERYFPDYVFLINKEKGFETASMLIEAKFSINSNRELEEAFKQVYSYGLRLSAKILVIVDKDAIWIYEKRTGNFDRTRYLKKYWKELEQNDVFLSIKKLIGK